MPPHGAAQAEEGEKETEVVPVRWFGGEGKQPQRSPVFKAPMGTYFVAWGTLRSALWGPLREGNPSKNRGDMCIRAADSLCWTVEANTTL